MGISYRYQTKGVALIAICIVINLKGLYRCFGKAGYMVIKLKELGFTGSAR